MTFHEHFRDAPVLVTGGAGFIGSHLVDALVASGARVRVLDNFATGHRHNVKQCHGRIELVEGDIRDLETCRRVCDGVRFVWHEAALGSVPRSMKHPDATIEVNVSGTANVFSAARDAGVERIVYASSSSVYGDSQELPKREGREGQPQSPYALSKWMNEELASVFARCFGMTMVGLRYFNVYGPRQDPSGPYAAVIPRFFAACERGESPTIFGDGLQSRDFTFVQDVVQANLAAMFSPLSGACVFNIGAAGATTVLDLAEAIGRLSGFDGAPRHESERPGDVRHSRADISAAERYLGYRPTTEIQEGLAATRGHVARAAE
ncbi:MAG: SDR family oxidoreductase [Polyangiaceae bacterium]